MVDFCYRQLLPEADWQGQGQGAVEHKVLAGKQ